MNESENKTAKDLLDESIDSIRNKEESSTEKLPISENASISDSSEKTIITEDIPTEKQVENPPKAESELLETIEDLKERKDDLDEINDKDIEEPISIKTKILSVCKICLKTLFFTFFGLIHLFLLLLPLIASYCTDWISAFVITTIVALTVYAYILDYKKYDKYKATMYTVYTGFIYFVVSLIALDIISNWDSMTVFQVYISVGFIILWILSTIFYYCKIKRSKAILLSIFSGFTLSATFIYYSIPEIIIGEITGTLLLTICSFALCRVIISVVNYRKSTPFKAILYSHIMFFMFIFYDIAIISLFFNGDELYNNLELWIRGIVFIIPLLIIFIICYFKFNKIKANIYYILLTFIFYIVGKIILSIIENWSLILFKLTEFASHASGIAILVLIVYFIFAGYKSQFTCSSCGSKWALKLVNEDIQDGYTKTKKCSDGKYRTYRIQDVKQVWRCKECGYKVIKNKRREIEL